MRPMSSRERVERAVDFREVDRVSIDLGGMKASSISVVTYNRLKALFGMHSDTRIWDPRFMVACVEEEVMRRFHVDVAPLDISSVVQDTAPEREWTPTVLYPGAEGSVSWASA